MLRVLLLPAALVLLLLPRRLVGQQPYPHLARVVGAIRTAALVAPASAPLRRAAPLEFDLILPPLANPRRGSHRQVLRISLSERVQLRATGDWAVPGLTATLGLSLHF